MRNRQRRSSLVPLVVPLACAAALGIAPAAHAQLGLFSRAGLQPIPFGTGAALELGSIASGARGIALRFRHDAEHGVAMSSIGHRGTRGDGTVAVWEYSTEAPAGESSALWNAVLRPVGSATTLSLSSSDADQCQVFVDVPGDTRRALFVWTGAQLPDPAAESAFRMELLVELDPLRPWRVTWQSRMGRVSRPACPNLYTLDEVRAPIVWVKAPGTGDFERLLVPIAGATLVPAANLPLRIWQVVGYDAVFEHPARQQQLQFSALYSGTNVSIPNGDTVLSPWRKALYFTTEDAEGHYKQFQHKVVADGPTLTYRWAPVYFPTYGLSPTRNFHFASYPVAFEAIEAATDSYWYDCTTTYRRFVDARMGLTRITSPAYALNRDFVRASPFVANSVVDPVPALPASQIFPLYTANALRLQRQFRGADGRTLPTFMEWQQWLKGDPLDSPFDRPPQDPIGPDFNPRPYSGATEAFQEPPAHVLAEIERAHGLGINTTVYTLPVLMNRNDWPGFRDEWLLRTREGAYAPVAESATGNVIDYGAWGVPLWMAGVFYDDVFDTAPKLGGVFLDVISGGGASLRYPARPEFLFEFRRYHGGTAFVRGTQRLFDLLRLRVAAGKPTTVHPDVPFLPTETVQEYLAGRFDFAQQGLKDVPMQMQLGNVYDALVGVPNFAPEAQNPSPPLWNAVYHEWARAEGLTTVLGVRAVNVFLGGGQDNPLYPGVDWNTWAAYQRMVHALWWFQGMKPTSFQYLQSLEPWNLLVDGPADSVTVRDPHVLQQTQLVAFLTRLHHALDREGEAGRFLSGGRLERPLQTPWAFDPFLVTQSLNPGAVQEQFCDPAKPGVFHFYENFFSKLPYPIPHVFHAVWRDVQSGDLALVFVNWSDGIAAWDGLFDPRLYDGFGGGAFTVSGIAPDGAGTTEYFVGAGSGPTRLGWNPAVAGLPLRHHDDAAPSYMPARSVQVFVVRPQ